MPGVCTTERVREALRPEKGKRQDKARGSQNAVDAGRLGELKSKPRGRRCCFLLSGSVLPAHIVFYIQRSSADLEGHLLMVLDAASLQ